MDGLTVLVILGCACATALLNCGLRNQSDPLAAAFIVSTGGAIVALPALAFTGLPGIETVPYLAVSTLLGATYWIFLGRAYSSGEICIVFPLAFGSAPVLILLFSDPVFQETLSASQLAVIFLICAGLLLVVLSSAGNLSDLNRHTLINSIAVTAIICAYTICDALAVRKSGTPLAYTVFLYISSGIVVLCYSMLRHRDRLIAALQRNGSAGMLWGTLSLLSYCGELWAMTRAPVALISALRETSILFAVLIAVLWLKEPLKPGRMAGAGVVGFGLVLMRLAGG